MDIKKRKCQNCKVLLVSKTLEEDSSYNCHNTSKDAPLRNSTDEPLSINVKCKLRLQFPNLIEVCRITK